VLCGGGRATRATPPTTTTTPRTYVRMCFVVFPPSLFIFNSFGQQEKPQPEIVPLLRLVRWGAWSAVESSFAHLNISITFFLYSVSIQWRKTYRKEKRLGFHFELERNWRQMLSPNKIKIFFFSKLLLPKMEIFFI
jgi:hypothetical protein